MDLKNIFIGLFLIGGLILVGYIIGRSSIDVKSKVEYIQLPSTSDTITNLIPVKEIIPGDSVIFRDTIWNCDTIYEIKDIDTTAIIKDYFARREYNITLFDIDTLGKCDIQAVTYKNRLNLVGYNYTPKYKVITNSIKDSKFELFGGLGINTSNEFTLQAGFFKNRLGFGYQFSRDYNQNTDTHGLNIFYKFKIK